MILPQKMQYKKSFPLHFSFSCKHFLSLKHPSASALNTSGHLCSTGDIKI